MEGARRRWRRSWGQTPPPPSPRLLPALSAAAAGGGGEGPPPARAASLLPPALPQPLAGSQPRRRESPTRGCLPGGRGRRRARRREASGGRTRDCGLAPPRTAGASTRQTEPQPALALIRAIGNPLARLLWFPPRAPLDFPSLEAHFLAPGARGARQGQSMRERTNAAAGLQAAGERGPRRGSAAV